MPETHAQSEGAALLPSHDEEGQLYEELVFEKERPPQAVPKAWNSATTSLSSINLGETSRLCRDKALGVLVFLIPSFISSLVQGKGKKGAQQPPGPLRPTAYLDGLRGLAAWAVFNGHLASTLAYFSKAPWGFRGREGLCSIWRLPVVRFLNNGTLSVSLFFVISGFALSISPIVSMRKRPQDPAAAMAKLSSAIFRRPFRLFIPSIASTIIAFLLIRWGYWVTLTEHQEDFKKLIHGNDPFQRWPKPSRSFMAQVKQLLVNDRNLFTVFKSFSTKSGFGNKFNGPLWTIALEFRSSIVLYSTHAALFYMSRRIRALILVFLIVFGTSIHAMDFPLFWAGFLIADYSPHLPPQPTTPSSSTSASLSIPTLAASDNTHSKRKSRIWAFFVKVFPWLVFLVGVYIGSFPRKAPEHMPGFAWMMPLLPFEYPWYDRYFFGVAAIALIFAIDRIPIIARFYCLPPIQYMGKISFSFYLCHLCIVKGIAQYFFWLGWSFSGKGTCLNKALGFAIGYVMTLSLTIWVADIFWRAVDIPTVNFAAKLEKWLLSL